MPKPPDTRRNNTQFWEEIVNGIQVLHRTDGPAIVGLDHYCWYRGGFYYAVERPSAVFTSGVIAGA